MSNQAMQHMLRAGAIQAKLTVNTPNDEYEQEADRVADQVMRMSGGGVSDPPYIQRACTSCSKELQPNRIQRVCGECEQELMRKEISNAPVSISVVPGAASIQRMCSGCKEEAQQEESHISENEISTATGSQVIQRMCNECEEEEESSASEMSAADQPPVIQRMCDECAGEVEQENSSASEMSAAVEPPAVQRMCDECEDDLQLKQRGNSAFEITTAVESQMLALQSGGEPLTADTLSFFEPRFGRDFSDVRIHVDGAAAASAQSLNALAYTRGSHIVFGAGQYQPQSSGGRRLLAHELTHIVQQSESRPADLVQPAACPGPKDQNGSVPVAPSSECTPRSDTVSGAHFLFCVDSDQMQDASEALLPGYIPQLKKLGVVEVHGYASPDGPKGKEASYNLNLSCRRANRAADMLEAQGIPRSRIQTFKHGGTNAYGSAEQNRSVNIPVPKIHNFLISAVSLLACAPCNPFTDDGVIAVNPPASESGITSFRQKHSIAAEIVSVDGRHVDPGTQVAGASRTVGMSDYCGQSSPAFVVSKSGSPGAGTPVTSATNVEGRRWESALESRVGAVVPCTLWDPLGKKPGAPCGYLGNNASIPPIGNKFFLELFADGNSRSGFVSATKFPFHYLYEQGQLKTSGGKPVHPVVDFDSWATSTGVSKKDAIIGFIALREACCRPSGKLLCPCVCKNGETQLDLPKYTDPKETYMFCLGTFAHYPVSSCPASCKPAGTNCSTLSLPANP